MLWTIAVLSIPSRGSSPPLGNTSVLWLAACVSVLLVALMSDRGPRPPRYT